MRVLPLFYNEAFTDEDIAEHECSDRIWCSPAQFRQLTDDAEPGITTLLHVTNEEAHTTVGCIYGVHHSTESDLLYVPHWMYDQLGDGAVIVEPAQLGLCTRLVLQPHTSEHLSAEDPQELLRDAFERYSCLTPGTTIPLWIGQAITVTISELGPVPNTSLCIRNCEVTLELLRPLDMPDEEPAPQPVIEPVAEPVVEPVVEPPAVIEPVIAPANTIVDARPRHVIMAEAARKRLATTNTSVAKN